MTVNIETNQKQLNGLMRQKRRKTTVIVTESDNSKKPIWQHICYYKGS